MVVAFPDLTDDFCFPAAFSVHWGSFLQESSLYSRKCFCFGLLDVSLLPRNLQDVLTSILLRRVTARFMTFLRSSTPEAGGTERPNASLAPLMRASTSSLSSSSDMCILLVPRLRLSRLDWISFLERK